MYDLLPSYPSLTSDPEPPDTASRPTISDFTAIGADSSLAELAETNRAKVNDPTYDKPPTIVPLSGSAQPTLQSYTVNNGQPDCHRIVDGHDWGGDGTVYAGASYLRGQTPFPLPQQHGPIAKSPEGLNWVKHVIQHLTIGPPMGEGVGLHVPTIATAGESIPITITHQNLGGITFKIQSITGRQVPTPRLKHETTRDCTAVTLPEGLYTVSAQGGGFSEVTTDVLVNPR
ncbi:MAG: hypothetical protein OEW83_18955 [Acidimicrobiia bacterium]|nr:hypothetical protein [Acidimicrobiia bacterium]